MNVARMNMSASIILPILSVAFSCNLWIGIAWIKPIRSLSKSEKSLCCAKALMGGW